MFRLLGRDSHAIHNLARSANEENALHFSSLALRDGHAIHNLAEFTLAF